MKPKIRALRRSHLLLFMEMPGLSVEVTLLSSFNVNEEHTYSAGMRGG